MEYFIFKINDETNISFNMLSHTSFMFSGTMLTHRQHCNDGYKSKQKREGINPFFNVASYGNEKLFRHIRTSLNR